MKIILTIILSFLNGYLTGSILLGIFKPNSMLGILLILILGIAILLKTNILVTKLVKYILNEN